jgi:NlpC/P60 family putative phage cell wall peptidase
VNTRVAIVDEARAWLGTKWSHQASLKGVGCDCIGLIVGVARELDLSPDDVREFGLCYGGYGRQPDAEMLLEATGRFLVPVERDELQTGDILLFRFDREPQHFGILSRRDPDYVIHAYAMAWRVVEMRLDELWQSRIVRGYRYRDVT